MDGAGEVKEEGGVPTSSTSSAVLTLPAIFAPPADRSAQGGDGSGLNPETAESGTSDSQKPVGGETAALQAIKRSREELDGEPEAHPSEIDWEKATVVVPEPESGEITIARAHPGEVFAEQVAYDALQVSLCDEVAVVCAGAVYVRRLRDLLRASPEQVGACSLVAPEMTNDQIKLLQKTGMGWLIPEHGRRGSMVGAIDCVRWSAPIFGIHQRCGLAVLSTIRAVWLFVPDERGEWLTTELELIDDDVSTTIAWCTPLVNSSCDLPHSSMLAIGSTSGLVRVWTFDRPLTDGIGGEDLIALPRLEGASEDAMCTCIAWASFGGGAVQASSLLAWGLSSGHVVVDAVDVFEGASTTAKSERLCSFRPHSAAATHLAWVGNAGGSDNHHLAAVVGVEVGIWAVSTDGSLCQTMSNVVCSPCTGLSFSGHPSGDGVVVAYANGQVLHHEVAAGETGPVELAKHAEGVFGLHSTRHGAYFIRLVGVAASQRPRRSHIVVSAFAHGSLYLPPPSWLASCDPSRVCDVALALQHDAMHADATAPAPLLQIARDALDSFSTDRTAKSMVDDATQLLCPIVGLLLQSRCAPDDDEPVTFVHGADELSGHHTTPEVARPTLASQREYYLRRTTGLLTTLHVIKCLGRAASWPASDAEPLSDDAVTGLSLMGTWSQRVLASDHGLLPASLRAALSESLTAATDTLGSKLWTQKEVCAYCGGFVSFDSVRSATCDAGHTLPRCCISFLVLDALMPICCSLCGSKRLGRALPYRWRTPDTAAPALSIFDSGPQCLYCMTHPS